MDNKYAKVDGEAHGASTLQQDLQQLRNAESRRNAFLWGQTHEPTVQYQMLSSENIHITLHRLIRLYLGIYVCTQRREAVDLKESRRVIGMRL